jgi:hypothetical protein
MARRMIEDAHGKPGIRTLRVIRENPAIFGCTLLSEHHGQRRGE